MKNVIGVKSATQRLFSAAKYFLRSHSASYPPCGNDEVLKVVCCYCMTGSEVSVYVVTQVFLQGETKKKKEEISFCQNVTRCFQMNSMVSIVPCW